MQIYKCHICVFTYEMYKYLNTPYILTYNMQHACIFTYSIHKYLRVTTYYNTTHKMVRIPILDTILLFRQTKEIKASFLQMKYFLYFRFN